MRRVTAHLEARVTAGPAELVLSVAVAQGPEIVEEQLEITLDGEALEYVEIVDDQGTRLHLVSGVSSGDLQVDYSAVVAGHAQHAPPTPLKRIEYLRPSRYADSDKLLPTAVAEFGGKQGTELVAAVTEWVSHQLAYVSGWSRVTDGAIDTLLARQGVCRDFAHLVVGLLRPLNVPARLVSVYAPGLSPMDFHAVAEAFVDGEWYVLDATRLAPRQSMLRIATGRDAADTAFLTVQAGGLSMGPMKVTATIDGDLPVDDPTALVQLG